MDSVAYKKLKKLKNQLQSERNYLIKMQGGLSKVAPPVYLTQVDPEPEPVQGKGSCGCDCEKQGSGMSESEIIKLIETAVEREIARRTKKTGGKITASGVPVKSGTQRASNPWMEFLKNFKTKHPEMSHREAMQKASPLYRAQK